MGSVCLITLQRIDYKDHQKAQSIIRACLVPMRTEFFKESKFKGYFFHHLFYGLVLFSISISNRPIYLQKKIDSDLCFFFPYARPPSIEKCMRKWKKKCGSEKIYSRVPPIYLLSLDCTFFLSLGQSPTASNYFSSSQHQTRFHKVNFYWINSTELFFFHLFFWFESTTLNAWKEWFTIRLPLHI